MPSQSEKEVVLDVDVVGAYLRNLANLIGWITSYGGQIGPKGDLGFSDINNVGLVVSMASAVHDENFRATVLKAGADFLTRAANKSALQAAG